MDSWGRTPLEEGVVSVWVHGPTGKDAPLPEKSLREKQEWRKTVSACIWGGRDGAGAWGGGPFWGNQRDQPSSGAEIPLETLVSMEGPGAR